MGFCAIRVVPLCLWVGLFFPLPAQAAWFVRGDVNGSGTLSVTDAVQVFRLLFLGEQARIPCLDAADIDDDGALTVTDGIHLLSHLFLGGPGPRTPVGGCWYDPTEDLLECESFETCDPVGIFFVGDKSGSMGEAGKWRTLQKEIVLAISQLTEGDQFAIVLFDSSVAKFPASGLPADANPAMKAAGVAYVMSTPLGSGGCAMPALRASLSQAAQSTTRTRTIHYLSDGFNTCAGQDARAYGEEILADLRVRNVERIPVNAVCIGPNGSIDEAWMKRLATETGGSYVRIIR